MVPRRLDGARHRRRVRARPVRRRTTRHGLIDRDDGSYPFTRAGSGSRDAEQEVSRISAPSERAAPESIRIGEERVEDKDAAEGFGDIARDARVRERGRERNPLAVEERFTAHETKRERRRVFIEV